jgi:transposase
MFLCECLFVTLDNIDINATIKDVTILLEQDKQVSPALKSLVMILVMLVKLLANRLGLNSRNSGKPPSTDQTGDKKNNDDSDGTKKQAKNKVGGQQGHKGKTLTQVEDPDEIKQSFLDVKSLPKGSYQDAGFIKRQVINVDISRWVTEYQAQVLKNNDTGKCYTASFPSEVTKAVQYGAELKAHAVYMSQYQLLPYNRVQEFFSDQLAIDLSEGSIYNFNVEAYNNLQSFDNIAKEQLIAAPVLHVDETGINVNGKGQWLHCATTASWTHFQPHKNRGNLATNEIGILPNYIGVLCHDHWKPYYKYIDCFHALCNAHHLGELTRAWEQDGQVWAKELQDFLENVNIKVHHSGGILASEDSNHYWEEYRNLLKTAQVECPPPDENQRKGKRGRLKRSKSRNLLERFINFEEDVLRFMDNECVPFTNNQAERDLRMTKVHQKISGGFRTEKGANMFCRIRGYLSTCRKQGLSSAKAMSLVFKNELPDFAK